MGPNALATSLFALTAALVGADLLADSVTGASGLHLGAESLGTLVAGVGAAVFLRRLLQERHETEQIRTRASALLTRARRSVSDQLDAWDLTEAEAEVGLLLLKGLSLKEVATVRETAERTAREQARAVYRKAGVGNRAELAAWFLDERF